MSKARIATVWLDGCSGCHMSFLDMDERLLEVAAAAELVYSPLVDAKEFPRGRRRRTGRRRGQQRRRSAQDQDRSRAHKDTGFTGRLCRNRECPRNAQPFGTKAVYDRAYRENVTFDPGIPNQVVPALLPNSASGARSSSRSMFSFQDARPPPTQFIT